METASTAWTSSPAPKTKQNANDSPTRERLLFESLLESGEDRVRPETLRGALQRVGLRGDDPRLADCLRSLEGWSAQHEPTRSAPAPDLGYDEFRRIVGPNALIVGRALEADLVIPEFQAFSARVERIFEDTREQRGGEVARYIPQLGRVDPERFGLGLCTIDGQRASFGDAREPFCVQSASKPVIYSMALEEHGEERVHRHVGREPSGQSFNELTLNKDGLPHNPMDNAGAIMSGSLVRPGSSMADRFDHVQDVWRRLAGGAKPGFSNSTYLSERQTADRNFALGYFMRENDAFPEGTDLVDALEFYFQSCSLEVTAEMMAVVAATLANGGVCPLTGERVFSPETVQRCLSLMYSCGMYDFSGEWAFSVGLPAKSGVSGVVMVVVPNVLGLCVWSPRLDGLGNSVRGVAFCRELVRVFNFHNYDNLVGGLHDKQDPRKDARDQARNLQVALCWAASEGDVDGIRRLRLQGVALGAADYDGRTALHLAASEGREDVVAYLLRHGVEPRPVDRWGHTPLDDARRVGHLGVVRMLSRNATERRSQGGAGNDTQLSDAG